MANRIQNDEVKFKVGLEADDAQRKIHELTKATENLRKQNTEHRKEISRLAATEGDHSAEIKRLNETIKANTCEIDRNKRAIQAEEKEIHLSCMTAAQLGKRLKDLKRQLANTSRATNPKKYRELERDISKTEKALAQATRSTRGFLTSLLSLDKMGTAVKGFFMGIGLVITSQVVNAFKQLTSTIIDFERANSKLAAVLGTSLEGVTKLTEQAKFLGRTTTATASQVTQLQTELAKLGFSQDVIEKLTPSVLKFSKAVDTDLGSAAAFAGAAMRIFDKDAGDAESVMATLAIATTKSALDFSKLQASLATVGPVANSFGFSIEETVALLGELSNAGFDASSAATATRNILLNLADSNGELATALGGPVTNLNQLVDGLKKLDAEGINLAKALELTDKRSVAAFSRFLKGADNITALRDSITDCNAEFNEMSDTMNDNAAGSLAGFQSAVEGLVLKFFDFREVLKTLFEWATELVNWVGSIVDAFSPLGKVVGVAVKVVGLLVSGVATLLGWFSKLFTHTEAGLALINMVVASLVAYKTVTLAAAAATAIYNKSLIPAYRSIKYFTLVTYRKISALIAETIATKAATAATAVFNAALKSNPIAFVAGLIATLAAVLVGYSVASRKSTEQTSYLTEATNKYKKAMEDAEAKFVTERDRLIELRKVAMNELDTKEHRIKAINELNRIVPNYNASLDEETGKYRENKKAIDEYLVSLEKKLRLEAAKGEYLELLSADNKARQDKYRQWKSLDRQAVAARAQRDQVKDWQNNDPYGHGRIYDEQARHFEKQSKMSFSDWYDNQNTEQTQALNEFKEYLKAVGISIEDFTEQADADITTTATKTANTVIGRIKEINAELLKLRKTTPESDEELRRIQKRIKALREEKKELLGNAKAKHEIGTYREDSIDEATAQADDTHQRNMLDINKQKGQLSDAEFTIKKSKEVIRYCKDLTDALEKLEKETDASHKQTLDKIQVEINKAAQQSLAAQQAMDKAMVQRSKDTHNKRLESLTDSYEVERILMDKSVADGKVRREAADMYMMDRERKLHEDQLKELERYYKEVEKSSAMGEADRKELLDKIYVQVRDAWNRVVTDTGKWAEKLRELSTNTDSLDGVKKQTELKIESVRQEYDAAISIAKKMNLDVTDLEKEKQRRIAALNFQYQEQMWQLQEQVGMSWADEHTRELASLENMHRQGLISEKDYQKARLNLQVKNVKKYFDYYSQLSGSMFSAIQDAEIAKSDAKYDVLIQQAKNNGEDTAALEEEKENKKLEIQKKYADVNFAIKVSQIIADTAVAVMKTFGEFGYTPWGIAAAAMMAVTGAAQVVSAKAERDKIKNMQPGSTAGGSAQAPAKAERVLSGYSDGGYTGNGDRYEVAGVVHRGEYVVPKPIMDNPRVVDAVGTIEAIRRSRLPVSGASAQPSLPGYADGGMVGGTASGMDSTELTRAVKELKDAVGNIRAHVVYKDIENAGDAMRRSRAPFTRKR